MKMLWSAGWLLLILSVTGCSWVKVSQQGALVAVSDYDSVAHCSKLGFTRSLVAHKIGFIERDADTMTQELTDLAKNEAAMMGGDTIVPRAPVKQGQMVFDVYRCQLR
ncbi:MAG: DUF4156 domain-containing protein [Thiomicrorhabdus chilensis]|uniref:DUF4156 domain-containing protein n=1 Tax=Thiomicrorhabdus chilensis TaxID=63656 RepID=UPI00299F1DC3|nr:DUF4156 domain-containing protein [Thiomicrorhabdus chilensis]MDX1348132.1 DUF4156 domain-containing protein [Thiomicrorhabdus chilensis]